VRRVGVSLVVGGACLVGAWRAFVGLTRAHAMPSDDGDAVRARARAIADHGGRLAVLLVALIGVLVVVGPAVRYAGDIFDDPTRPEIQTETKTVITAAPGPDGRPVESERETTTTTTPRARSLLDRGFAPGGLLLLRIAIAAAAAFLAGAVTQRVLLGRYDVEIGPGGVKLGDLGQTVQQQGADALKLTEQLEAIDTKSTMGLSRLDASLSALAAQLNDTRAVTREAILDTFEDLQGQLDDLRSRVEAAGGAGPSDAGVS
jgi:hypothetical protein